MAGRVLSCKEEGGHLRQQPVIAQGLSGVGIPATVRLASEVALFHRAANPAPLKSGRQFLLEVR